jgi:hypothetical protein
VRGLRVDGDHAGRPAGAELTPGETAAMPVVLIPTVGNTQYTPTLGSLTPLTLTLRPAICSAAVGETGLTTA